MAELDSVRLGDARSNNIVALLLLMVFLLLGISSSSGVTVTLDEPLHYAYGQRVLQGNTSRIDDSSMPVSALNALPGRIAASLPSGLLKSVLERFFVARLVTIIISSLFALLVFRWSRSLYGFVPASFSLVLYVLDPNIIAHSQLVTDDVFEAGMVLLTFYLLWRFVRSRKPSQGLFFAAALGLSQLVKYTSIALFPLTLLALVLHDLPTLRIAYRTDGVRAVGRYAGYLATYAGITLVIVAFIINIGFLFNRTFTPLKDYRFQSESFQSLQARLPAFADVRLPLPYPYLEGLDWIQHTEQTADRYGNIYLLGQLRKMPGFPGYYFIASLLKVPLASQLIILAALAMLIVRKGRRAHFLQDELFLLLPVALFAVYFNFFFNAQTGIRYFLVVFPLLYVFAGGLFIGWGTWRPLAKASGILLVVYLAISVFSYFPTYIPYFNEIVWNKTRAYKYLSDSNLEWGQSQAALDRYLSEHPDAVYAPSGVQPGLLVVGGSDLVGIVEKPERYAWLREHFEPVDTVAYSYFVYRISPEAVEILCTTYTYCK